MRWVGVDYGSKMAGTTVICYCEEDQLFLERSAKGKDADRLIYDFVTTYQPYQLFLDAPLSLPKAFFGKGTDFFYRVCDRELNAMSPMFLGGLTARAMALKTKLSTNCEVFETYPKALVNSISDLNQCYHKQKSNLQEIMEFFRTQLPLTIAVEVISYHDIDAILCWWSGYRYHLSIHQCVGDSDEGVIIY